jgi:hypothetical protein
LLSFRGISTPSLPAQGEQRRSSYFNIPRGNSKSTPTTASCIGAAIQAPGTSLHAHSDCGLNHPTIVRCFCLRAFYLVTLQRSRSSHDPVLHTCLRCLFAQLGLRSRCTGGRRGLDAALPELVCGKRSHIAGERGFCRERSSRPFERVKRAG